MTHIATKLLNVSRSCSKLILARLTTDWFYEIKVDHRFIPQNELKLKDVTSSGKTVV